MKRTRVGGNLLPDGRGCESVMASPYNPHRRQLGGGQSAWPDLPPELLESVLGRLAPLDRVAVRLVCSSWRSCARASISADLPFEAPRLLLRRPGSCGGLAFFSLHRREILPFALPDRLSSGRCCGQIGGWLAMAFDEERAIELRNLFSGQSVPLPRSPVFPVAKIVLSAPPTSLGWVAAVLGRAGTVALLQPDVSGGAWITIAAGGPHGGFRDVALWRGRLCALGDDGTVLAYRVDLRARVAAVSELRGKDANPLNRLERRVRYLLESDGELLLVKKLYSVVRDSADVEVEVSRFRPEGCKWESVTELPGRAVFLGSVASAAAPATAGVRENCVYFARRDVELMVPHAIGVYSLGDRETAVVAIAGGHSVEVEPVWILPSVA
ncbi:hypothetical protein CFC21_037081 [Triticum aestivum]|uniref:F-box domain-containing protein n=3 Tax=Triticum TaxID=4564 RepID=A0A9R0VQC9_TRITD|nr:uncharacterized protein LOC123062724 [Triticum aestivum]KAF7024790.1 hypothetical protein CFC21_037081 [Triticum aestivum]VAH65824.1 unnamed protein product [Triticum turgidum subsp. durum]